MANIGIKQIEPFAHQECIPSTASVIKLGIQAPANTTFHINGSNAIHVGDFGIYELDLSGVGKINSLIFDDNITNVIVDVVYEGVWPEEVPEA